MAHLDLAKGSIDHQLVTYAAMKLSAEEISKRIGGVLSPARVQLRVKQLLSAGDWLTDTEQENALLIISLHQIGDLQQVAGSNNLDASKVLRQFINDVSMALEKRRRINEGDINRLYQAQARIMSQAISLAFQKALFELQKRYPEMEETELEEILREALPEAIAEIESYNSGDPIEE